MSRRVSLPGASELFGGTAPKTQTTPEPGRTAARPDGQPVAAHAATGASATPKGPDDRKSSGRVKHDTKITVYVTEDELIGLEQARLSLRAEHGVAADRGRIVREAIDVVLADFVERGADSVLVQRLRAR